jgi:hypothetical protein
MLLTEPHSGSDVGALSTTAVRNPDGSYSLTGSKIFITGGDQDLTENIIHPVLARIEGAPSGTKGISLFLVPKILVNEDGSLGEPNDIVCTGIINKMGIHGSATCLMDLGSKGSGFDVCVEAIQVMGGYGYTRDYPLEQLARDCKVTSIYEGTNGIQAMDLLGRKLGMRQGAVFMNLLGKMQKTAENARKQPILQEMAGQLDESVGKLGETAMHIGMLAMSPKVKEAFSYAKPFLDSVGDVCMAWMHLWRASVATDKLEEIVGSLEKEDRMQKAAQSKEAAFYEGIIQTAVFFLNTENPITMGKMDTIKKGGTAALDIPENALIGI